MHALSNAALLDLWESGRHGSPIDRALLLLAAAAPEPDRSALGDVSIPRRDAAVLALRRDALGPRLQGVVNCPDCSERLEFDFDADAVLASAMSAEPQSIRVGELRFRLPNSADLIATAAIVDPQRATRQLLQKCCLNAAGGQEWSNDLLAEAEAGLAAHAGAANTCFNFACEACGSAWDAPFDICAFVWEELERRAEVLLDDVHRLAVAYGWDEQRILALGDARRGAYLARCDA
jgi:hypothetical protein